MMVTPATSAPIRSEPLPGLTLPLVHLEISRGRTRYPLRPVTGPRYFIGAGASCDLCLGGDEIPAVHSWIQFRGQHLWLEAAAPSPPLRLNGDVIQGEWLRDGDEIEIGRFHFVARIEAAAALETGAESSPLTDLGLDDDNLDMTALSAAELVEMIEIEQQALDAIERQRAAGAEALWQGVARRTESRPERTELAETKPAPVVPSLSEAHLLAELERLVGELQTFSEDMESRTTNSTRRELDYQAAILQLANSQQQLVAQVETLARQLAELRGRTVEPEYKTRASA